MRHKLTALFLAVLFLRWLTACGSTEPPAPVSNDNPPQEQETIPPSSEPPAAPDDLVSSDTSIEENDILVAYFSRVGITPFDDSVDVVTSASLNERDGELVGNVQYLAEFVAGATGGDLFQIITETEYPIGYRDTTDLAKDEQNNNTRPALASHVEDMEQYDVIFLGYPNWWGTLPQAVMTFLEEYDFSGKTIVPFCSHGGSALGRGPGDIAVLCPDAQLLDGFAVSASAASGAQADVEEWINGLELES